MSYSADDPLRYAGPAAQALLTAAEAGLVPVTLATPDTVVGSASAVWGGTAHTVAVSTSSPASLPAWPGQQVSVRHVLRVPAGAREGDQVGLVLYTLGRQRALIGLHLDGTVHEPDWWWRLTHP